MHMSDSSFDNGTKIRLIAVTLGALALVAQFTLRLSLPEAPQPAKVSKTSPQAPQPDVSRSGKG